MPGTRQEYWVPKLNRNVERDIANHAELEASGWKILILWECDLSHPEAVAARVRAFLG